MLSSQEGFICSGCQPKRSSDNAKHKSKAAHRCSGNGCLCGSCNSWHPVTDTEYKTWMANLGGFYVENTKLLVKMVKSKKLKPDK